MAIHTLTIQQVDRHIHELRRARVGWVEILQRSNYAHVEALTMLASISNQIASLKGLFSREFEYSEPSLETITARSASWTRFVPLSERVDEA